MSCFCFGGSSKGNRRMPAPAADEFSRPFPPAEKSSHWHAEDFSDSESYYSDSNTDIYDQMERIFETVEVFHVPNMSPCTLNARKIKGCVKAIRGVGVIDVDLETNIVRVGGENFSTDEVISRIRKRLKKEAKLIGKGNPAPPPPAAYQGDWN